MFSSQWRIQNIICFWSKLYSSDGRVLRPLSKSWINHASSSCSEFRAAFICMFVLSTHHFTPTYPAYWYWSLFLLFTFDPSKVALFQFPYVTYLTAGIWNQYWPWFICYLEECFYIVPVFPLDSVYLEIMLSFLWKLSFAWNACFELLQIITKLRMVKYKTQIKICFEH